MDPFDNVFQFLMRWEGGYVNDPLDAGGETNFGISKRAYPDVDIKNLTAIEAKAIYRQDYWEASGAELLPPELGLALCDYAVNAGVHRAVEALQRIAGSYPDGKYGPKTHAEVSEELRIVGPKKFAYRLCKERADFYISLARGRQSQMRFLKGWLNRVFAIIEQLL